MINRAELLSVFMCLLGVILLVVLAWGVAELCDVLHSELVKYKCAEKLFTPGEYRKYCYLEAK